MGEALPPRSDCHDGCGLDCIGMVTGGAARPLLWGRALYGEASSSASVWGGTAAVLVVASVSGLYWGVMLLVTGRRASEVAAPPARVDAKGEEGDSRSLVMVRIAALLTTEGVRGDRT